MTVSRRRVLYIPGYDPFPPRRYRELYRKESAKQAAISGYEVAQGRGRGPNDWTVTAQIEGAEVSAEIEVLVWSDIVSGSMEGSIPGTYLHLVRTAWAYIASGALFRLMRLRGGPIVAALYPIGVLLLQLVAALGFGWLAAVVARTGLGLIGGGGGLALAVALAAGALAAWRVLAWFKARDNRLYAWYLMHDYAFSARWGGAYPTALETRMAEFGDRIVEAAADPEIDEVLVVGHSSGAHLGISVLADLIRANRLATGRVALLTLGQVVPMVSFLPGARRLRGDLHVMGGQTVIPWVDVTAPGDGCSFALCDPVGVTGVAPEAQTGPLILSAAFSQTLTPEHWQQVRRQYFNLHFQYLRAFDLPGDYDYFRITAGPQTLAQRFDGRPPSPSTKRDPVNRFRDFDA